MIPRIAVNPNGWVVPFADSDRNYTTGQTYGPGTDVVSRATESANVDSDGNYYTFPANTLSITDMGAGSQLGTATNEVFNTRGEGGTSYRLPDNWLTVGGNGITFTPQGPLTVLNDAGEGVEGYYWLVSGTASAPITCLAITTGTQECPAVLNDILSLQSYIAILPPSMFGDLTPATPITELGTFKIGVGQRNSAGSAVANIFTISSYVPDEVARPYVAPGGLSITAATTAFVQMHAARFTPTVGTPAYFYLWLGGSQIEVNVPSPALLIQNPPFIPQANLMPNPTYAGGSVGVFPTGMSGPTAGGIVQTPVAFPIVNVPGVGDMQCMDVHVTGTVAANPTTAFMLLGPRASPIAAQQGDILLQTPWIAVLNQGAGFTGLSALRVSGLEIDNVNNPVVSLLNGPTAFISSTLTEQRYQYTVASASCVKFQPALAIQSTTMGAALDCYIRLGLWFINKNNSVTSTANSRAPDVISYTDASLVGDDFTIMAEVGPGEWQANYWLLKAQDAGGTNSISIEYTALDTVALRVQRAGVYDPDVPMAPGISKRLIAGAPARGAISGSTSHIVACINGLAPITVAAASPISGPVTFLQGPSGQQIRRRAATFRALDAGQVRQQANISGTMYLGLGYGQSNALQSQGFMVRDTNGTSFFLPGDYSAPKPGLPHELMPLCPPTLFTFSQRRVPDIRCGGNQSSVNAVASDMQSLAVGATAMVTRQLSSSSSAFGASETILRLRAARRGPNAWTAYYCGNVGGASAANLTDPPVIVPANGYAPFNNLKINIDNFVAQAKMQNWSIIPEFVYYNGNTSGTVTVQTQIQYMEMIRVSLTNYLQTAIPGSAAPIFITDLYSYENGLRQYVLADINLPAPWIRSGPTYFNGHLGGQNWFNEDFLHFMGAGSSMAGEKAENAVWQQQTTGDWMECKVISATKVGTLISAIISVPVSPLVEDDGTNIIPPTLPSVDKGIQILLARTGAILPVASYAITNTGPGRARLDVQLVTDPTEQVILQIALYGYTTPGPPYDPIEQARCVYRDSNSETFLQTGLPKYNWLSPISLPIP